MMMKLIYSNDLGFCPCHFVGWFVSEITQNLQSRLDGGWVSALSRLHELLVWIQIKGTDPGNLF